MFRLCTCLLLALVASTGAATLEPHLLRSPTTEEHNEDSEEHGMNAKFSLTKTISCNGGCSKKKGMERKCGGYMEQEYSVGVSVTDMTTDMAAELSNELSKVLPTDKEAFSPSGIETMEDFDDDMADSLEDGFSKKMKFGGSVKADWECAVTYSKSGGKFSKKVECGFSSTEGSATIGEVA